ncbi:MAG TPA: HEPN domain-containing protein [bacterium]|nr:HEPN domain-containing protein [bacterium]
MAEEELQAREEAEKLIKRARIKAREIDTKIEEAGGPYDALIYDAYNAMFMAARAALHVLGFPSNSHRTVVSQYKHQIVEKKKIDPKFADHLLKIQTYWEEEQAGTKHDIDSDRAHRISTATREIVDALAVVAGVIEKGRNPARDRELYLGHN